MRSRLFGIALAVVPASGLAEEFVPRDYSPTETIAIRTLGVKEGKSFGSRVQVAIANRSAGPVDVVYSCSVFNAAGDPIRDVSGMENAVPPGQEVASSTNTTFDGAWGKVACRVTDVSS